MDENDHNMHLLLPSIEEGRTIKAWEPISKEDTQVISPDHIKNLVDQFSGFELDTIELNISAKFGANLIIAASGEAGLRLVLKSTDSMQLN